MGDGKGPKFASWDLRDTGGEEVGDGDGGVNALLAGMGTGLATIRGVGARAVVLEWARWI